MNIEDKQESLKVIIRRSNRKIRMGQRVGYFKRQKQEAERLLEVLVHVADLPKPPEGMQ